MIKLLIFCLLLLGSPAVHASNTQSRSIIILSPADYAHTRWAGLRIPAGTRLVAEKTDSEKTLHRLEFEGNVTISETENGGTIGIDNSKQGAILCAWMIFSELKPVLDTCYSEETELRKIYTTTLEKLKTFIIQNSLQPMTEAELDVDLEKKRAKFNGQCRGEVYEIVTKQASQSEEMLKSFEAAIEKSLSIARPPVGNPCL